LHELKLPYYVKRRYNRGVVVERMRAVAECYGCLDRLITTTSKLASEEPDIREKALSAGRAVLKAEFSTDRIPTEIATLAQRAIKEASGNADPFKDVKRREQELAARVIGAIASSLEDGPEALFRLAALGNTVDFFKDLETVAEDMKRPVKFVINQIPVFLERLRRARRVLLLADNAGECHFDLPLHRMLSEDGRETVYIVKEQPVQNDLTLEDLAEYGLKEAFGRVASTGTDSPGLDIDAASPEFKSLYEKADLIVAKGMGYYETFSETLDRRVFHLLRAKCAPVAAALGVPHGSYVAAFGLEGYHA
jgi:hypothetical protein